MSTLWRGLASQFFLLMLVSNQNALAAEPLVGNVEKFELTSLNGAAKNSGSNLNGSAASTETHLNGSAKNTNLNASTADSNAKTGLNGIANSTNLNASADSKSVNLKSSSGGLVLQGGIEDRGTLNNSAKLTPDRASKPMPLNGEAKQVNFPLADARDPVAPKKPVPFFPESVQPSPAGAPHFIPPISSYGLSPRIGVITAPGYSVPSVQTVKGITSYVPGFEVSTVKTNEHVVTTQQVRPSEGITRSGGVTVYTPDFSVQTIQTRYYGSTDSGRIYASKNGVTTFMPGFELGVGPSVTPTSARSTMADTKVVTTHSGISSYVPGFEVTIAAAPKTTSTWHPGRVETVTAGDYNKSTLSGIWYSPSTVNTIPQLVAGTQGLPVNREYAQPIIADDNRGLKATAQVLSAPHSSMGAEWDAWYERVGRAIYSRWERAEVGPGTAKVRITVDQFRALSCEVIGFRPAPFVESDSVSETAFRVTALRAVNDLSQYEIPELPPLPGRKHSVTFDLEMSRSINGPTGLVVAVPR